VRDRAVRGDEGFNRRPVVGQASAAGAHCLLLRAFLEGAGGGGAPVAIAGAFLIGLGFNPFQAATLCLVANTAPVAWGGVGNPIRTLAGVTGLPEADFSAMAGRILPPISLILPFWLVRSMVGWRETVQVWPALLVSGASFAAMQFYWSNFQEPGLVDIVAAVFSLLVMVAFLKNLAAAGGDAGRWRIGHIQSADAARVIERGHDRRVPPGRDAALRRGRAEGMVAIHHRVCPHLRHRAAGDRQAPQRAGAQHPDAAAASGRDEDAAGRAAAHT
jgi:hypothetical protein